MLLAQAAEILAPSAWSAMQSLVLGDDPAHKREVEAIGKPMRSSSTEMTEIIQPAGDFRIEHGCQRPFRSSDPALQTHVAEHTEDALLRLGANGGRVGGSLTPVFAGGCTGLEGVPRKSKLTLSC